MKLRSPRRLSALSVLIAFAFAPLVTSAQDAPMMSGAMKGEDMMGAGMDPMSHMTGMVERASMVMIRDRIASLETELKITEAQTQAWTKFADALRKSARSMKILEEAMARKMSAFSAGLPDKLENQAKMAAGYLANLNAIKAALDPLYASLSDEQKKIADRLRIDPWGVDESAGGR